jgi:hypothetical protein
MGPFPSCANWSEYIYFTLLVLVQEMVQFFCLALVGLMIVGEMDLLLVALVGYFASYKTHLASLCL